MTSPLDALAAGRGERLRHVTHLPARPGRTAPWPGWVAPPVSEAFRSAGIDALWTHQAQALEHVAAGRHVVVATGTASGKSLVYLLPALTAAVDGYAPGAGPDEGPGSWRPRGATALYLSPTKALAADQLARIEALAVPGVRAATYDGDSPTDERRWIRQHANLVLTNPDLVHHSLLPHHDRWAGLLRSLTYVVVDECHTYRGVFGAHVALLLRRLRRVAQRYGSDPVFVMASATVADPGGLGERLIGSPVEAVTDDGSPRGPMTVAFWEPPTDEDGTRRSATTEAGELLGDLASTGVQTVAFVRSRAGVEAAAAVAARRVDARGGDPGEVAAYRGGYLPEERRALEARLREGSLRGLAATNALELGVDVAGLDAVVVGGWPGRRASFWQQAGRAGRSGSPATVVLVAADDPLDTYLMAHPAAVLGEPVEGSVFDPSNVHVLAPHLAAAAAELPVTEADERWFGSRMRGVLDDLVGRGVLRWRPTGWYWTRQDRAVDHVSLRGIGQVVSVVERRTGRVVGTVDGASAVAQVHAGAVHVHQGVTYVVTDLDLEDATAHVVRGDPGWTTHARAESAFDVVAEEHGATHGPVRVSRGVVRVRCRVTSFVRRLPSGEVIGTHPLDLPEQSLTTRGVWWTMTPDALAAAGIDEVDVPGAAHAAEHAAIGMLPLLATCDRWDIGGVSTALHPDTGLPTVMVYDGYPGGAGFAEHGHRVVDGWLMSTRDAIAACPCDRGCPGCVQSPKCGNGNEPLDKAGAVRLLDLVLAALSEG